MADELSACEDARVLLQRLEQLVARREAELASAREHAVAEGREQGRREALAQEAARLWDAWDAAARSAQVDLDTLREALVALSLQVVQRIASDLGPAAVMAAIAEQAARALPGVLEVRADASLGRVDCTLSTPAGQRLAGLPAQLDRLAAQWRDSAKADA